MKLKKELLVLERPFLHLYIGEENDFKSLYLLYKEKSNKDNIVRFIEGSKCNSLNNIFSEFAKAFQFPNYFGNNWQALDECLNDLDWLSGNAYLLFISNIMIVKQKHNNFTP